MTAKHAGDDLRQAFLGWQCRIRQIAMRQDGGRPSPGMQPRVLAASGAEIAKRLTVLLLPKDPEESTAFFRFQVMRSADPRDIYERALTYLQADFFQQPSTFSDQLLAIVPSGSRLRDEICGELQCVLAFDQFAQRFTLPCSVRELAPGDPAREAAVWHNRLFNPALPDEVHVLCFTPDWDSAEAESGRVPS
jgi:hypothetical protein